MSTEVGNRAVSLWDLLTMLAGASSLGGGLGAVAVEAINRAKSGGGGGDFGVLIGVLLSAVIAILSVTAVHLAGKRALRFLDDHSPKSNSLLPFVYFAKFVWVMALAPTISFVAVGAVVRIAMR